MHYREGSGQKHMLEQRTASLSYSASGNIRCCPSLLRHRVVSVSGNALQIHLISNSDPRLQDIRSTLLPLWVMHAIFPPAPSSQVNSSARDHAGSDKQSRATNTIIGKDLFIDIASESSLVNEQEFFICMKKNSILPTLNRYS